MCETGSIKRIICVSCRQPQKKSKVELCIWQIRLYFTVRVQTVSGCSTSWDLHYIYQDVDFGNWPKSVCWWEAVKQLEVSAPVNTWTKFCKVSKNALCKRCSYSHRDITTVKVDISAVSVSLFFWTYFTYRCFTSVQHCFLSYCCTEICSNLERNTQLVLVSHC